MKLSFISNLQLDIQNWQERALSKSYGIDAIKYLPPNLNLECVQSSQCLRNYLKPNFYDTGIIDQFQKRLINEVNVLEIQNDLESLMNKKFPAEIKINVYITTFRRAPYNSEHNFFYIFYRGDENFKKSISNIYHELMHFLFHWNYWQKCRDAGLKDNQIHDIKEAFTVLLNPILEKRNLPLDSGYKIHQDLRKKITDLWEQKKDFKFVLEKILLGYHL